MPESDKFFSINIREYLALGSDKEAGEPALVELLSGFSCPKNQDVEQFLKKRHKMIKLICILPNRTHYGRIFKYEFQPMPRAGMTPTRS